MTMSFFRRKHRSTAHAGPERSFLERWTVVLVAVLVSVAGVAGSLAANSRSIAHRLGTTSVSGSPQRVVALEFSFVEALDALGVVPVGVADDNQAGRVEQLLRKPIAYRSVGTRLEPNLEIVASLAPDLIIADETRHANIARQLNRIAPTVVLNSWEGSYRDIKDSLVTIADALGSKEKGEAAVAAHEAAIRDIRKRIPAGENRRFLLVVVTPDAVTLHTSSSFSGSIFEALGLKPALVADRPLESGVGLERLASINPDILFVASDGHGTVFDQWRTNPVWQAISAVRNGNVIAVDRNRYTRFRGLKTAEILANDIAAHLQAKP